MKKYIAALYIPLLLGIAAGCKKEKETLTPSGINDTYVLPQGQHDFDQQIVQYYQKYGSYLLYKFSDRDAYWSPGSFTKPRLDTAGFWVNTYNLTQADENYIPAQLQLIQQQWFNYYSDTFLKKFLPVKILLCSNIDSLWTGYVFIPGGVQYTNNSKSVPASYFFDNVSVNYGSSTVNSLTAADKRNFLARVNLAFIQSIHSRSLSAPIAAFTSSADYVTAITTQAAAYGKGIISAYSTLSAQTDWNAYITAMVTWSETDLNTSVANTDATARGILNPTKDTNGKIRQRYNIVRNYFINTYQVDLQKVGNAARGN